ncbi:glycosyltransferase family 4 protein [Adlercreutzia sp. ZJ138]|uniref:glycosyltransferase family 4 protein n=1 Tax=Adlercreutzia sp. ZJ138 TaxID=2709405 RepID=UPI0013ECA2CA|nr:glycosyltransferase family 4 protein [Adlercreutzia sp. ZJ138]
MLKVAMVVPDFRQIQGINALVMQLYSEHNLFLSLGIELIGPFDCYGLVDVCVGWSDKTSGSRFRKLLSMIKKTGLYTAFPIQSLLLYLKHVLPAKQAVDSYITSGCQADILVFHDCLCAAYYLEQYPDRPEKTVIVSHASGDPCAQLFSNRKALLGTFVETYLRRSAREAFECSGGCIVLCERAKEYVNKNYHVKRMALIPNGVKDIAGIMKEASSFVTDDLLKVICVASLIEIKGQDVVIDAVSKLTDIEKEMIQVSFVGQGEREYYLKKRVQQLGLNNVFFLGERNDVNSLLNEADLFVLMTRYDNCPMSIVEAMRVGLPIISTPVGAITEMIEDGSNGYIIAPDALQLKGIFSNLIHNKTQLIELSANSRIKFIQEYSSSRMISRYVEYVNLIMNDTNA